MLGRLHALSLRLIGVVLLICALPTAEARQSHASCADFSCGLSTEGSFPYLAVGRVAAVADAAQSSMLFRHMRRQGGWKALPEDDLRFGREIQTLVIDAGDRLMAVNMSRAEMAAAPIQPGDFVRYAPHHGAFEKPPEEAVAAAFWAIDGCVAILCRAGDDACVRRYMPGVFDKSSGMQMSLAPPRVLPNGRTVDVDTLLPRDRAPR